jgi:hypothetical protein
MVNTTVGKYGGGSGTEGDPYQIWDANHMQAIGAEANDWDKHFVLMADIDLGGYTGTSFNIIGNDVNAFTGAFDGNGNTISNFTWNSANDYRIGLFGYLGGDGVIRNLELENVDVNVVGGYMIAGLVAENNGEINGCSLEGTVSGSESWIGGLVASNRGTISDCHVRGSVSSAGAERGDRVGGLVGESYSGSEINGCSSECTVVGDWGLTGGLVGENWSVMSDCSSSGIVSGLGDYSDWVGGLVGKNVRPIMNCYSTSSVSGHDGIGGLVGCTYSQIMDSYSLGNVSGHDRVGGLVGRHQNGLISMCYSRGNVSGNSEVGGLIGYHWSVADAAYLKCFWDSDINPDVNGIGNAIDPNVVSKTTAEMKKQSTFTNWDFITIWNIGENQTYPYLRDLLAGDINKDGIVNFLDVAITSNQWMEEE